MLVPIPMDDLYEDHDRMEESNLESNLFSIDDPDLQTCQGCLVEVLKNGDCKVVGCHPGLALCFRTSPTIGDRLRRQTEKPRIYFEANEIQLRTRTNILYINPIERFLSIIRRSDWLIQLVLERSLLRKI